MNELPGYGALRHHRSSIPGATYFITLATHDRKEGLNESHIASAIKEEISALEQDGTITQHAAVIMPDHMHLLMTNLGRLKVGQVVARTKVKTRSSMMASGLRWQGNYYEHRMREVDQLEEVVRYIFLNPYRAELISQNGVYPHFWLG
jgi:putative transposase